MSDISSLPSFISGLRSIWLKITSAAAIPLWIIAFVRDKYLTGLGSIAAAPKNAMNVPGDILSKKEASKATQVITASANARNIWIIGDWREFVNSSFKFWFLLS